MKETDMSSIQFYYQGGTVTYWYVTAKKGVKITKCEVSGQDVDTLEVPSKIDEATVTEIGKSAFALTVCNHLVLPDIALELDDYAFAETAYIKEIHFLRSPKIIPTGCFSNSAVEKIVLEQSEKVISVQEKAFTYTSELSSFSWPCNATRIPKKCFYCSSIEKLEGAENVEKIGDRAFACSKISEFYFPKVKLIEKQAFSGCKHLEQVVLPDSCEEIQTKAFSEGELKTILNTKGLSIMGEAVFAESAVKEFDWPAKIEKIPDLTFSMCEIKKITNIEHVKGIGTGAFSKSNLELIDFPSLQVLDPWAFAYSTVKEVIIPESCRTISDRTFYENNFVEKIYLKADKLKLDLSAFINTSHRIEVFAQNCESLTVYSFDKVVYSFDSEKKEVSFISDNDEGQDFDVLIHINFETEIHLFN